MSSKIVQKLKSNRFQPANAFEAIIGFIHSLLLDNDFFLVVEQASDIPGFAPSVRELPKTQFLPSNWNQNGSASLLYKNKRKTGKTFSLNGTTFDDSMVVTLMMRGGESRTLELNMSEYVGAGTNFQSISEDTMDNLFQNSETLVSRVQTIINDLVPAASTGGTSPTSPSSSSSFPPPTGEAQKPWGSSSSGRSPTHNPYNVGRSDLDPFGNVFIPRVPGQQPPNAGQSGNLVGPGHPMFDPFSEEPRSYPFQPGSDFPPHGMPQPRFDPFGPVTGPNSDIDLGGMGIDPRNPRIPQNDPRRRNLGEPNPDHLKPPGW